MTVKTLKTAGWLAMASAFLSLPAFYLSWRLEGRIDTRASMIQGALQVAGTLLFVVLTLLLKRLLQGRFAFHATDRQIDWLIKTNVLAGMLGVSSLVFPDLKELLGSAALLLVIVQGGVQALFGFRLLALPDDLKGLRRPFCFANMATGICIASVVLILVGIGLSAITDLMLGTIFFQLAAGEERGNTPVAGEGER